MAKPLTSYDDLGKNTRDMFSKPFFPGLLKLKVSTKTSDGVKFTVEGEQKEKAVSATLKAEFKDDPNGISITEKWETNSKISLEVGAKDHVTKGLKFTGKGDVSEKEGGQVYGGEISAEYAHEMLNAKVSVKPIERSVGLELTAGTGGFVGGLKTSADLNSQKLNDVDAKVGFLGEGYSAEASALKTFREFGFSYYQTVNASTVVVGSFELKGDNPKPGADPSPAGPVFTIGGEYKASADQKYNCKVNSEGKVNVAYSFGLAPGVSAGVAMEVDVNKFGAAGAKTGFSLRYEA
jgi:hypothetical protein